MKFFSISNLYSLTSSFFSRSLITKNLPSNPEFSWLSSPLTFKSPRISRNSQDSQVLPIKHPSIDLSADVKTRNRSNLLILAWHPTQYDISKLVLEAKALGFKSWVLRPQTRYGSQLEFEKAVEFIKEKPSIIAFGNWINQIQNSSKLDYAVAVRHKFDLEEMNNLAREENKRKNKEIENWKAKQLSERSASEPPDMVFTHEIPKLECKKPVIIYTNTKIDNTPADLPYIQVHDIKSMLKREPLGNKEFFLLKLLLSLRDSMNSQGIKK